MLGETAKAADQVCVGAAVFDDTAVVVSVLSDFSWAGNRVSDTTAQKVLGLVWRPSLGLGSSRYDSFLVHVQGADSEGLEPITMRRDVRWPIFPVSVSVCPRSRREARKGKRARKLA